MLILAYVIIEAYRRQCGHVGRTVLNILTCWVATSSSRIPPGISETIIALVMMMVTNVTCVVAVGCTGVWDQRNHSNASRFVVGQLTSVYVSTFVTTFSALWYSWLDFRRAIWPVTLSCFSDPNSFPEKHTGEFTCGYHWKRLVQWRCVHVCMYIVNYVHSSVILKSFIRRLCHDYNP